MGIATSEAGSPGVGRLGLAVLLSSGALGGMARYFVSGFVARRVGETFPWGTLIINVSGAFVIGMAFALSLTL